MIQHRDPQNPCALNPSVPQDLRTVLDKALEKERDRRYSTALDFAEDLRRVREYKPVHARPITRWIRVKRWAQRNPWVAGSLVTAFVCLTGGLVTSLHSMGEAQAAREQAESERRNVLRVAAFWDLEKLRKRAREDLWPLSEDKIEPCQAWLEEARALVARVDPDPATGDLGYLAQLKALRRRALPQTAEEREQDRLSHPRLQELMTARAQLHSQSKAQAVREGRISEPTFALGMAARQSSAIILNEHAWDLAGRDRMVFGREAEGLALARLAVMRSLTDDKLRHAVQDTLAWALFANGLDQHAVDASQLALQSAPPSEKEEYREYLEHLERSIASVKGEAGRAVTAQLQSKVASLETKVSERRTFTFASDEDRWWHGMILKLIQELEGLANEKTGLMGLGTNPESGWGVSKRLKFMRMARDRLASDGLAWRNAATRVLEHPDYAGCVLKPQFGLVPLGPDPASGLEEFADLATGDPPRRWNGQLELTEETGVTLVLLPGSTFLMGSQRHDPDGQNFDRVASMDERPVAKVAMEPFFLSKYELTQGQWLRMTGQNPSRYHPENSYLGKWVTYLGKRVTLLHPVEQVTHHDCERELARFGFKIPTEAQWEYGCRAGTATPWWTGAQPESLRGAANLGDLSAREGLATWSNQSRWAGSSLRDGYVVHAPVGSGKGNGFGIFDVHGNVWEWCQDWYTGYSRVARSGDGLRGVRPSRLKVQRGGSFGMSEIEARSAYRNYEAPEKSNYFLGVRPARVLIR
jgi:formylglycine-generating enzyme required for sulfatase activity